MQGSPLILWRSSCRLLLLLIALVVAGPLPTRAADGSREGAEEAPSTAPPKDVAELRAIEEQVRNVVANVLTRTVAVRVGAAQGCGVIVSEEGHVLTAGHVAGKPGQQVRFTFADGKTAKGTTLGIHRRADAGLMRITDEGQWPFVEMGQSGGLRPGCWCVAVGHPLGYQEGRPPVVRVGRVLRLEETVIQTDCPLVAGDSGGPLFDLDGKVVGINSRIAASSTSMNYHVPIDVYHQCWDRLVDGEAWDDGVPGKNSSEVKAAFRQVVAEASACVVRVKCDGKDAALGTIVGPDGWVLTKASELKGRIVCRSRDSRELEARLVGVHPQSDLAMLKIDATGLPIIRWSNENGPSVGQWVATPGLEEGPPMTLGVISVPRREIPPASGVLGVAVSDADGGARIVKDLPNTAAQKVGLKVDDVITHVNGKPAENQAELIAAIKRHQPGDVLRLTVRRGDEKLEISAKLTRINTAASRKRQLQNRSHVGISKRHDAFPTVLQHDTVLRPVDCGGPLVDLSGKVIGVNIARGGRTETYSIPSDVLLTLMYDLMSGRLPPPKPEAKEKPESEEKPQPEKEPGPKQQPEAEKKTEPEKKPEAEQEPEPEEKPEPKQKREPEKEPEPEQKAEPEDKPQGEKKPDAEPKPEAEREPDDKAESEQEPEEKPQSDDKPEAEEKPTCLAADGTSVHF